MACSTIDQAHLRSRYQAAGQDHVFDYFESLSESEKGLLLEQLNDIEVEALSSLLEAAQQGSLANVEEDAIAPFSKHVGRTTNTQEASAAHQMGMSAIRDGKVAALVLAGGQGTRLGFSGPKGMYNIGLPSGKALFQLLAERLKRLQALSSKISSDKGDSSLPFYIMTSPINHQETVEYFQQKDCFGLNSKDVLFFQQGMLPCMTEEGKIIMETACRVAMAPDG